VTGERALCEIQSFLSLAITIAASQIDVFSLQSGDSFPTYGGMLASKAKQIIELIATVAVFKIFFFTFFKASVLSVALGFVASCTVFSKRWALEESLQSRAKSNWMVFRFCLSRGIRSHTAAARDIA
jgi:hypothetical protein